MMYLGLGRADPVSFIGDGACKPAKGWKALFLHSGVAQPELAREFGVVPSLSSETPWQLLIWLLNKSFLGDMLSKSCL